MRKIRGITQQLFVEHYTKSESSIDANFVIPGGTAGGHDDNVRRHNWRQIWLDEILSFQCYVIHTERQTVMSYQMDYQIRGTPPIIPWVA